MPNATSTVRRSFTMTNTDMDKAPHARSYSPPTPPISASSSSSNKMLLFTGYSNGPNTVPPSTQDNTNPLKYSPIQPEGRDQDDGEMTSEKMDKLIERKRKRRESHNVVERKRRDNINARIDELSTLLPPQHQQSQKLNRGMILQNSVNHIRVLHQRVTEQQERIQELEAVLDGRRSLIGDHQGLKTSPPSSPSPSVLHSRQ